METSHQKLWGRFVTNELMKISKRSVSKTNAVKTPWYNTFWANPSLLVFEEFGREKYLFVLVFFSFSFSIKKSKIEYRT